MKYEVYINNKAGFDPNQQRNPDGTWGSNEKLTLKEKEFTKNTKVVDKNGNPLKVYHVTTERFNDFDVSFGSQGVGWFTSDKISITDSLTGASLRPGKQKIILTAYLNIQKMAGWNEYDKYSFGEMINLGYDGVKLDNDYIVFENNQVLIIDANNKL